MYEKARVIAFYGEADIVIKTAAVADYRPKKGLRSRKIKKSGEITIELERTKDILKELGSVIKTTSDTCRVCGGDGQHRSLCIGKSLKEKKPRHGCRQQRIPKDGAGFASDTNHIVLFTKGTVQKDRPWLAFQGRYSRRRFWTRRLRCTNIEINNFYKR